MLRDPGLIPLSHQHHNGLALCVLVRQALERDGSAENVARQAKRIADRYEVELANHFQLEEEILFAVAQETLGPITLVSRLATEHRRLEKLAAALASTPTRELVDEFCTLLPAHIRCEENELFQDLQQRLPRSVLDRMGLVFEQRAVRICL
jgi:hemerythrin-like domain-containing protein